MRYFGYIMAAVVLISCAAAGFAQTDASKEVLIFRGSALNQEGITLSGWGSGKAVESKEKVLAGSYSLKMITHGYYAGGRIEFQEPPALFKEGVDKNRYVVFACFFSDTEVLNPAANTEYAFDIPPYTVPKPKMLRFVFESVDGIKVAIQEPTKELDPDDNWVRIAVPLAKFNKPETGKEFLLKSLTITTDIPSTFYLGEIKLVTDTEPIRVDPLGSQTTAVYYDIYFMATADGGVSSLKYTWDFDKSNGVQEETVGKVGHMIYTKGGDFTVTLTVSDVNGIKEPVKVESVISVTD